jgi:site-specific DNA-methyltransferase (adenine-specific)
MTRTRIEQLAEGVTLYLGDSRDILPTLGPIDCVITDPPYGATTHIGARSSNSLHKSKIDFSPITAGDLVGLCTTFCEVASRWVVMTCEWQHAAALQAASVPLVRLGVWIKPNAAPQFSGDRPGVGWEAVAILHRKGRKRWNGGGHHAVWHCPIERGKHPTQKPERLVSDWIRLFTNPGETIFDPFMGSGTTGVAAVKRGRKFIGIEINPDYFELACRRVALALSEPQLALSEPKLKKRERVEA